MTEDKKMKTYILHYGDGILDSNYFVRDDTCASVDDQTTPHRMNKHPYVGVLIDHPTAGWILYDLGPTTDPENEWTEGMRFRSVQDIPEECTIESQLALVGIKPEDVNHVVLSHLHADHVGNLAKFADTADFYVAREEMADACLKLMQNPDPEYAGEFWYLKDYVLHPVKSYTYIDHDMELFPGIDVITLPGHTACVLGLVIHGENTTVIPVADAINEIRNYNGLPPAPLWDSKGWRESVAKVKEIERQNDNVQIVFGHSEEQFNELKHAPEYYD